SAWRQRRAAQTRIQVRDARSRRFPLRQHERRAADGEPQASLAAAVGLPSLSGPPRWTWSPNDAIIGDDRLPVGATAMKHPRRDFPFVLYCTVSVVGSLAMPHPARAADESAPRFSYALFDGDSLDGWTAENGCEAAVEDGLL